MMLVTLTDTTKVGATKTLYTKKGGVEAKIAMEYETLYWHKVTIKQKENVLDTVPQEMAQETTTCVYERPSEGPRINVRPRVDMRPCVANGHKEREVEVTITPSTRNQTVISDDFKDYLPSEAEGCNK